MESIGNSSVCGQRQRSRKRPCGGRSGCSSCSGCSNFCQECWVDRLCGIVCQQATTNVGNVRMLAHCGKEKLNANLASV